SPWNKFFQDNELRLTIKQDVIRTFPEVEFFRKQELGEMMTDILFVFSREHATHSYRQGMHELLAPLIFVLHCDHQAFLHACEIESVLNVMKEVMDPAYLEHDAYTMFCQVMETVEPWYLSRDIFCNPRTGSLRNLELLHATPFSRSQDLNPSNAIVTKLTRIQDYILKKFDQELHQHLERLEIAPQIYGIRWLRLLFGREFPMQDLLMLWDAIFGDGIGFDLVDYIFVAMLLYIRDILLTSDYATCLTVLMKFPPVADVHYFVVKAMWLREPNQHPRPPNYTHQGPIKTSSSMGGSSDGLGVVSSGAGDSKNSAAAASNTASRKARDIDPIGSTVSLSQVEETMFRNVPSASSLARLDTGSNLRSAQSSPGVHHGGSVFPLTPDDLSVAGSPTKFNTLPNKTRGKQKKLTKMERELQDQVARLQGELHDKENMCRYCSSKLDVHIERLQQDLSKSEQHIEGEVMVSLAGLKLVRDILNGTLRFTQNIASDEDLAIVDGYYGNQNNGVEAETCMTGGELSKGTTADASPESDILLGASSASSVRGGRSTSASAKEQPAKLFYMSSEETASPSEDNFPTNAVGKSSGEGAGGFGNEGEMRDLAAHAQAGSTNPFHDSFRVIGDSLNSSCNSGGHSSSSGGSGGGKNEGSSSSTNAVAASSSSSSSKIKNMFKISSTPGAAAVDKNNSSSSRNRSTQYHPSYVDGDPLSATAPQPPPSFSAFETLPASLATAQDNGNLSSLNISGEYSTSANSSINKSVSGKNTTGVCRELSSFESTNQRSRAKSDVTGSNSYWPDFLSSNIRLPWYTEGNGEASERSRERSKSQPLTGRVAEEVGVSGRYNDGEDDAQVNPLYKLRYHDNMEH
ncbi:TBC1 domain family member 5, partial [Elysia marginata]